MAWPFRRRSMFTFTSRLEDVGPRTPVQLHWATGSQGAGLACCPGKVDLYPLSSMDGWPAGHTVACSPGRRSERPNERRWSTLFWIPGTRLRGSEGRAKMVSRQRRVRSRKRGCRATGRTIRAAPACGHLIEVTGRAFPSIGHRPWGARPGVAETTCPKAGSVYGQSRAMEPVHQPVRSRAQTERRRRPSPVGRPRSGSPRFFLQIAP